ncbi:DUF5134 domain-containing protein [Actinocatenispora sera]|uniref:DUF5134 domain-containing protein n=1 Tax=Actinocatenispora sera TaxID=390989 RepID=UPI0033E7AF41
MTDTGVPAWWTGSAAAALVAIGAVRLLRGDRTSRDVEVARIGMAAAMAAMALADAVPRWCGPALLAAGSAWSLALLARHRWPRHAGSRPPAASAGGHAAHRLHHLAGAAAMAYLLTLPQFSGGTGMHGTVLPATGAVPAALLVAADLVLIGFVAGSAVLTVLGATRLAAPILPGTAPAPRATAACQLLMSLSMLAMLYPMLRA